MGRTQRKRNAKAVSNSEPDTDVINFLKWLKLKKNHFKIVNFKATGRGVLSTKSIAKAEELVALPLKFLITLDIIKQCEIPELFNCCGEDTQTALTLFLVLQRHLADASFYACYLKILPPEYSTLWFCSDTEKKSLPFWLSSVLEENLDIINSRYKAVLESLTGLHCSHCHVPVERFISYEEFLWAWTTVNTRAVYFEDENEGYHTASGSMALAPFLDLFNHSTSASVEAIVDHKRSAYILKTNKPFKKKEQVYIKYGAHSNLKLLLEYGFITDGIDQDCVEFTVEEVLKAAGRVSRNFGEVTKLKYKFIKAHNLNRGITKSKDEFSWNCNGLLYVLVTKDCDLENLLAKTYSATLENNEKCHVDEIKRVMIEHKRNQLMVELQTMENIGNCSVGFGEAKKLVRQYIHILGP